jgi:hypothetical protein
MASAALQLVKGPVGPNDLRVLFPNHHSLGISQ